MFYCRGATSNSSITCLLYSYSVEHFTAEEFLCVISFPLPQVPEPILSPSNSFVEPEENSVVANTSFGSSGSRNATQQQVQQVSVM